jgi:hypothetical protein
VDAQPLAGDLQREMAIAEMPGDPQQRGPVGCLDLEHRLGRRTDEQVATNVEFETVPVSELTGPRQIKQKGLSGIGGQSNPAAVPIEISQCDAVDCGALRPVPSAVNRDRPAHCVSTERHCEAPWPTKQSRSGETPSLRDCFAALAMTATETMVHSAQYKK